MRLTAAMLVLLIPASQADALACAPRAQVVAGLAERYHETQLGAGLHSSGTVLEVYTAPNGTWTVVASSAAGMTCIIAVGTDWTPGFVQSGEPL